MSNTDYRREAKRNTPSEAFAVAGQAVGVHVRTLPTLLPRASDYKGLKQRWVSELVAGATVGVVALPLALGFGVASGAGANAGIITAIVAGILAAIFGGSHLQVSGPTGAMTVVLLPVIARYGIDKIPLLALMAGVLLVFMALAGLGRTVDLIPWPVVEGFTMGIGVIIFLQQIPLALDTPKGESESTVVSSFEALLAADWTKAWLPLLLAALVIGIHLALNRVKRNLPISLIAVVVATVAAWALNLGVTRIGELPRSLPLPSVPDFDFALISSLAAPALAVAALAALESLLSARVADGLVPSIPRTNPDRELLGQGIANLGSGLFGGLPATGAIARTGVNVRSGGRTRVSAIFHSLVLTGIILLLAGLVGQIPTAALAGVLMWTAVRMVNLGLGRRIVTTTRADRMTFLLTLACTVVFDLVIAVLLGVAMAAVHSLRHMASYSVVRREFLPVKTSEGTVDVINDVMREQLAIFRVDGALFYGNARRFVETVMERGTSKGVVIRMHRTQVMDASGADALKQAIRSLNSHGITVVVQGMTDSQLRTATKLGAITPEQHAATLPEALIKIERAIDENATKVEWVFSYGSIKSPEVQQGSYGRQLEGHPDSVAGFSLEMVHVADSYAGEILGYEDHPYARYTADDSQVVEGVRLAMSPLDLQITDRYIAAGYRRVRVRLASGTIAWLYITKDSPDVPLPD